MSLMANPGIISLRSLTRRLGLNRLVGSFFGKSGYEVRLEAALREAIAEGDCVWDVGANVGWYTLRFAQWVGPGGQVVAFEPARSVVSHLRKSVADHPNITVWPVGLSNRDCSAPLLRGHDELGATSMIVADASAKEGLETVVLARGDTMVKNGGARLPDLVKIDVEGHELEVLEGLAEILEQSRLRHLFIEMHFAVLESQGRGGVPATAERLLRSKGFTVRWVDRSHLHASR